MTEQTRRPNGKAEVGAEDGASQTREKKKASDEARVVTKKDNIDRLTNDIFFPTFGYLFSKKSSIAHY